MMTKEKLAELRERAEKAIARTHELAAKGDDVTPAERAELDQTVAECNTLAGQLKQGRHDLSIMDQAREMSAALGLGGESGGAGGHLAFTGASAKTMARNIIAALPRNPSSGKALAAGQQVTSTIVLPEVVPIGRPAQSILDVLPSRIVPPSYSFLRQSVRTFPTTGPTPEGATKPTATVGVAAVENRLRVCAFISEQINHYLLTDAVNLERFVVDDLIYGLRRSIEAEVISGDGTGEHFLGILNTSGIVAQPFVSDALTSVRTALTVLHVSDYEPGVIALSAQTWQEVELQAATANAVAYQGVPVDASARRLWGVPVVLSQGLGAKTGLVIGDGAVTVDSDGNIATAWSDSVSDDFAKNYVRCRVETRAGVSVNQPGAVVKVGTQA